jgi:arginyl-tRNA synthetase
MTGSEREGPVNNEAEFLGVRVPALPDPELPINNPDYQNMPKFQDYTVSRYQHVISQQVREVLQIPDENEILISPVLSQLKISPSQIVFETADLIEPDFALACHGFAKNLGKKPVEVVSRLAGELKKRLPQLDFQATVNGYVNMELPVTLMAESILTDVEQLGDGYGEQNIGNGAVVVIDLSSPNIAKHFSVGHLRSTIIGESIARLYEATGHTVIRDNHLGDWGTQFGKLGRAYELWHGEIPELNKPETAVDGLYKLYVRMNEAIEKEKKEAGLSQLEQEGRDWFKRLESGDVEAALMFQWACTLSMQEFERVYEQLGSSFNYQLGESFYVSMLPGIVEAMAKNGMVYNIGDNALAVQFRRMNKGKSLELIDRPLTADEMEAIKQKRSEVQLLVVSKRDGASVYSTRDLAALAARTKWFSPQKIVYVVGEAQQDYFKMVFAAFQELAGDKTPELVHVPFGLITLPDGKKMSTRQGQVIFLEDVLKESVKRAKDVVNKSNRKVSAKEADIIAKQVGVGAVVFMDIGQGRERNIEFNWEEALSLQGKSGPYIQYAHTRCRSLLNKAAKQRKVISMERQITLAPEAELRQKEKSLVVLLGQFPEVVRHGLKIHEPSKISEYLLRLTDAFNSFYAVNPILNETDINIQNTRLRLVRCTAQVIKNGLHLLNIEAPEKM